MGIPPDTIGIEDTDASNNKYTAIAQGVWSGAATHEIIIAQNSSHVNGVALVLMFKIMKTS
jgi:hypothetical protein